MQNTARKRIKDLKKEADQLWSKVVKAKARNVCMLCGGYGNQAHHIVSRRFLSSRFNPFNGVCLCNECHKIVHCGESGTREKDVLDGLRWMIDTDKGITNLYEDDYKTIIASLEARLAFYNELSDE